MSRKIKKIAPYKFPIFNRNVTQKKIFRHIFILVILKNPLIIHLKYVHHFSRIKFIFKDKKWYLYLEKILCFARNKTWWRKKKSAAARFLRSMSCFWTFDKNVSNSNLSWGKHNETYQINFWSIYAKLEHIWFFRYFLFSSIKIWSYKIFAGKNQSVFVRCIFVHNLNC